MSKQQTAVEFLVKSANEIFDYIPLEYWEQLRDIVQQSKQMEKEHIKSAYNKGYQDGEIDSLDAKDGDVQFFEDAEQYYNETYQL
jgi:hypothetical protein